MGHFFSRVKYSRIKLWRKKNITGRYVDYLVVPSETGGALNVEVGTMLASPESKAPIIMLIVNTMNVHTTGTWLMNSDDVLYSIKWKRQSRSKFSDRNIIPMKILQYTFKDRKTNDLNWIIIIKKCILFIMTFHRKNILNPYRYNEFIPFVLADEVGTHTHL